MQNFSELALSPQILRAITEMGYETPSPIQAQAIPRMLEGPTDFLGLAGTGTGKTAAFAIPLLSKIDIKKRSVQSLILCPTRELAMQVAGQIELLGKYLGVRVATVYGGAPYGDQIRALRGGAQVVVGTPGRVIDHLEKQTLMLTDVTTLILDEADEMFSMGFKEEIDKVVELLAESANTWLFSATMSPEVRRVVERSLKNPVTVQVSRSSAVSANVEQLYYRCQEFEKAEMICKLMEAADDFYGIIFCQTKALVADLTRFMLDRGYKVDCLHGDMDQNSRERTMQAFRDKKLTVLVCTDVAARGLDVKDITHVVNYSLPRELENYVHRIGRTARSGKTGIVMNLVTFSHRNLMYRIESHTKAKMTEAFVPGKREIAARKVARMLPAFADQPVASRALEVMSDEFKAVIAEMTPEDVASRFIVMMMPDIFGGVESRSTKKEKKAVVPGAAVVSSASAATSVASVGLSTPVSAPSAVASAPVAVAKSAAVSKPVAAKPAAAARPVTVAKPFAASTDVDAATGDATEDSSVASDPVTSEVSAAAHAAVETSMTAAEIPSEELTPVVTMSTNASVIENLEDMLEDDYELEASSADSEESGEESDDDLDGALDEDDLEMAMEGNGIAGSPVTDAFDDEVVSKKRYASSIDEPPRSRKKQAFNEEELEAMLNEEPVFGVRKERAEAPRSQAQFRSNDSEDTRPRSISSRPSRPGGPARSDSFGSRNSTSSSDGFGPRSDSRPSFGGASRTDSRPGFGAGAGRGDSRPGGRFERAPRFAAGGRDSRFGSSRPEGSSSGFGSSRPMSRPEGASAPRSFDSAPRGEFGGSRPATRPSAARPAVARPTRSMETRPEAPMNLGKPPKHEAGPARSAREGESGGLNRRARRAALFGRTIDGTSEA